jgi:glycosyltransferase involved in cell wall biosynthesis
MSFAKPVVATSVGGIPEVVTHEKTGLLSPRRDPQSAAAHICRLLADPALRRRLGDAGYRMVQEKFDVVDRVRELLSYYGFPADTNTGTPENEITSHAASRG